jgi:hypothetical protein
MVMHQRWAGHPVLDVAAATSQRRVWGDRQGHRGVWLDGFRSGIEVARSLLNDGAGKRIPLLPVDSAMNVNYTFVGHTSHTRFATDGSVVHAFKYPIKYDYLDVDAGFRSWWGGLYRADCQFGEPTDTLSVAVRTLVVNETGLLCVVSPASLLIWRWQHWPAHRLCTLTVVCGRFSTIRFFGMVTLHVAPVLHGYLTCRSGFAIATLKGVGRPVLWT